MSPSSSWALLVGWAALLLIGILLYGNRQLVEFDPQGTLLHQSTHPNFDTKITGLLQDYGVEAGSIIHVGSKTSCFCDTLSEPHQSQLLGKLEKNGYSTANLLVQDTPKLAAVLPSTPALIIIDADYKLRYLGPYATGYGCFTGKDLVDEISQYASNQNYTNAVVKSDADGCFCTS